MEKKWFSVQEAAEYFKVKEKTMYSLAARGRLGNGAVLRIGRAVRINLSKVEESGIKK